MKYIEKQQEPQEFTEWKALANDEWQPTYGILRGVPKRALNAALMQEQGGICCYCERRLTDSDSHIEHFRPQSDLAVDALDYSNMLCSCQNSLKPGDPRHCGNLKDDWFDDALLISPLAPGCEERFAYTGDGEIQPASSEDGAAIETIKRLGLGIPKLNKMRAEVLSLFLDDTLTDKDLQDFITGYLKPGENRQLGQFWTTIRYLFGEYATA